MEILITELLLSFLISGTNGGISLMGTIFSGLGGFVVGVAFYLTLILSVSEHRLSSSPAQWPIILVATLAGFLGSAIDSYLGALCQYSGKLELLPWLQWATIIIAFPV